MLQESFCARWRSLLFISAVVVLVTVFRPYKSHAAISSDGIGYHLWTRALLEGDLSFRRYAENGEACGLHLADPARRIYQNKYPPGLALLRLPVMAFLVDWSSDHPLISWAEHLASLVLGALALLATCLLCLHICRLLAIEASASHLALVTMVFGTGLFHYGTHDGCFTHIYSALGGTLLLWLGTRVVVGHRVQLPRVATFFVCVLLVLIRNTNVLLLAGLSAAYVAAQRASGAWQGPRVRRDLLTLLCGCGAGAALQLAYNRYACGHWVLSSYQGEPFVWTQPKQLAVLFSYRRGLFTHYPVVAVSLVAGLAVRRTRPWAAGFGLVLLAYTVLYGFWSSWMLGSSFGYRGMVEVLPAGIVLLAGGLAGLGGWRRQALSVGAWLCMLVTLQLLVGYWTWRLGGDNMAGLYWQYVCGRRSLLWFLHGWPG
jgi:hypothetical protein